VHTYETIFITRPTLSEDEERTAVEALSEIVTSGGGNLVYTDRMGRRRLCYPIGKQHDGVYTRLLYDSEPAVPKELERRSRLSDEVLRLLTVRLEPAWAEAAKVYAKEDAIRRAAEHEEMLRQEQELAASGGERDRAGDAGDSDDDEFGGDVEDDLDDEAADMRRRR
jgi:small subunit ribosomal protein S6